MQSHIGKLHDEILLLIFDLLLERAPENGDFCQYRPNPHQVPWWLMRVCRRWASILVSWTAAWSYVTKVSSLARSGEFQLLDVYLDNPTPETLNTVVAGCRERLRQLHLFFDFMPQYHVSVDVSSSTIRSLTFCVPQQGAAVHLTGLDEFDLPNLKKLRMMGTDVAGLTFKDLSHLCVEGVRVDRAGLVEVLRKNVGLKELIVIAVDWHLTPVTGVVPVQMPFLRWVHLDKQVADLMVYVELNRRFALLFRTKDIYISVELPHTSAPPIRKLRVQRNPSELSYDITVLSEDHCIYQMVNGFELCLQALVADRTRFGFVQELWIKSFRTETPFQWDTWKEVLEHMNDLDRIYVEGGTCKILVGPLCMLHTVTGRLVCPKLRQLVLTRTTINFTRLVEMVKLRQYVKPRLRLLELAWVLTPGDTVTVEVLKKYVKEVYVLHTGPVRGMSIPEVYREIRHDRWIEL